jgi:hypothetical protein
LLLGLFGQEQENVIRTYALMDEINCANGQRWRFLCGIVWDENTEASSDSPMQSADVHGIFDE